MTDGRPRRRFLRTVSVVATVSLAGCGGRSRADPSLSGPVAEEYRTAEAIGGQRRDPDRLYSKSGVNYHRAVDDRQCANCAFYVPDKNGDGLGACAIVEGYVEPDGWCSVYERVDG